MDKIISDLEVELRKIDPEGKKLSAGALSLAVTTLNSRVRHHGLSASQIHFSRDHHTGQNLTLRDSNIKQASEVETARTNPISAKSKAPGRTPHVEQQVGQGDTVYLRSEGDKHTARNPLLVTKVAQEQGGRKVTVHKINHSNPGCRPAPDISSRKMVIDEKYLYVPPHKRSRVPPNSSDDTWWRKQALPPVASLEPPSQWQPNRPATGEDDEDIYFLEAVQEPQQRKEAVVNGGGDQLEPVEIEGQEIGEQEIEEQENEEQEIEGQEIEEQEMEEQEQDQAEQVEGEDLWNEPEVAPGPPPPDPNLPPQAFPFPPWPPAPRQRLGATSATPKRGRPPKGGLDIVGRAVYEGEAIKYLLPENQGGERRGGVMSATVLHMAKSEQRKWPRWYNVRTQDRVDLSIELNVTKTWWVFRSGRWYPGDHPRMPPPDAVQEEGEEQGELQH